MSCFSWWLIILKNLRLEKKKIQMISLNRNLRFSKPEKFDKKKQE